ncbi:acyl-CoA synthetase [Mycobacterium sherrisii]|uniref:Acyl-CoA synthetase n=1 Tax=Mycobacterium sherrisii TaxID=243061 RepID=A0A1E3T6N1_9MYCO|nr:acyl-CoA synthetase [Mycobacterium sherrisii]ODR10126.1 acyl-CoA synthetase [Mycobacterium sherrisii]
MYPGTHALTSPDRHAALLFDTGEVLTYGQLEEYSVRLAHVLYDAGLRPGDVVALLSDNDLRLFEVYWAALRSGLYITAVNHHLSPEEVAYIVNDSGARALVVSSAKAELAVSLGELTPHVRLRLAYGDDLPGYRRYSEMLADASPVPFDEQPHGAPMLYSSGTTGRPKGVRPQIPADQISEGVDPMLGLLGGYFGVGPDTVYLSPAPLYHAAPLRWSAGVQAYGGTVVVTKTFDAEGCLRAIEQRRITHAQFVPTMFVRMLKLPNEIRESYDTSSLIMAVHAAAPCPIEVKSQMIDWWGPILMEYYGATEGNGFTVADTATWLSKPGTVGKPVVGVLHICDDKGNELPPGEVGNVYFERETEVFSYHNDLEKTRAAQHPMHRTWTTVGDVGFVDDDGYLFLTDRKDFTIISGGVNIYPQETENVLALHPAVFDVAVIGVPDPEMGQSVLAIVQPAAGKTPSVGLGDELIRFVKDRIAPYKAPKAVQFVDTLPRSATGKLVKGILKARFGDRPAPSCLPTPR